MKMKIGLYFGTFNPIHVGHLIIANHMAEFSGLDQIWLMVTPHNPLKQKSSLLEDQKRFHLAELAVEGYSKIKASDFEFKLPQPNYTVNTLAHLENKFPQHQFSLIMGEDNLKSLHKWKNYQTIIDNYLIYVYPRISTETAILDLKNHKNIQYINAPIVEISSTFIRENILNKKNVQPLLPQKVWEYIDYNNIYKK